MSTIKTNNVQLGQSVTATNNFTWYQPASPDGTVRLGNGNAGSVTDLITLGSTGNLTFTGTTETYTNSVVISAASTKTLTLNGGAGSNGLVLDASNNVGIGTTSPGYKLDIQQATTAGYVNAANFKNTDATGYVNVAWSSGTAVSTIRYAPGVFFKIGPDSGDTTSPIVFATNNATAQMTLNASGNLGLGVTPSAWGGISGSIFQMKGNAYVASSTTVLNNTANGYFNGSNWIYTSSSRATQFEQAFGTHKWYISTDASPIAGNPITFNQAMTLDASGNLLVGKTSTSNYGDGSQIYPAGTIGLGHPSGTGSGAAYALFGYAGGGIGSITQSGTTSVNFNGNSVPPSDIRLKENLYLAPSALPVLEKLQIKSFDWKGDGNHQTYGVIAQEVLEVFPEFVSVPDESDKMLGINQSAMVPFLVKAIQELSAELNELKQKVNA